MGEPSPEQAVMAPAPWMELTDNCHHYTSFKKVPLRLRKYWKQRYSIFAGYDYDIYLTDDAWFGVTPQPIAEMISQELPPPAGVPENETIIVDLFAGAGGNTIAFANSGRWAHVIGIERDADTLACAQQNAYVYEVPDGAITWIHGDCFEFLRRLRGSSRDSTLDPALHIDLNKTVFFASPPWGGIDYQKQPIFDLSTMQPYNLRMLRDACRPQPHALYLPRTSDIRQLAAEVPAGAAKMDVAHYLIEGLSKAMVAYFTGDQVNISKEIQDEVVMTDNGEEAKTMEVEEDQVWEDDEEDAELDEEKESEGDGSEESPEEDSESDSDLSSEEEPDEELAELEVTKEPEGPEEVGEKMEGVEHGDDDDDPEEGDPEDSEDEDMSYKDSEDDSEEDSEEESDDDMT